MFGSDSFPLGPNGQFPPQRMSSYGTDLIPPVSMQDTYLDSDVARMPSIERDFHSSINKVKGRLKYGDVMRSKYRHSNVNRFRPRYAPKSNLGQEFEDMDYDSVYVITPHEDEGEVDDSVGQVDIGSRSSRALFSGLFNKSLGGRFGAQQGWFSRVFQAVKSRVPASTPASVPVQRGTWGVMPTAEIRSGWVKPEAQQVVQRGMSFFQRGGLMGGRGMGGDESLGAVPRRTSSGRTIAKTWRYGKSIYYATVRGADGKVERGQIVGRGTSPIDYI